MSTAKFKDARLLQIILAPQISEKSTYIADKHEQVVFRVAPDATKPEVKADIPDGQENESHSEPPPKSGGRPTLRRVK